MFFVKRRWRCFQVIAAYLQPFAEHGRTTGVPGLTVLGLVMLLRSLGLFQGLECRALDAFLRWRPAEAIDERVLIVGIDDKDLQRLDTYPISDRDLAKLLQTLEQYQPRAIGVDIFRDLPVPPGDGELKAVLANSPNIIGIEKVLDNPVPPPPTLPAERVGFVNFPLDRDGFVRRVLLGTSDTKGGYHFSLALRLAERFLAKDGITLENGIQDSQAMRFGQTELTRFQPNSGSYVRADAGGNQILLNVRSGPRPFQQVSLRQVMTGQVEAEWIRDRIVIVGYTAFSAKDTVNSAAIASENPGLVYGVEIHAHVVSQILSAVLDGRPLLQVWPDLLEYLWIGLWGLAGGSLVYLARSQWAALLGGGSLVVLLLGTSFGLLLNHTWVPIVTPLIAFIGVRTATLTSRQFQIQQQQQMTMRLLGQQTSPEIATALWEGRHHLTESGRIPGQSLTATILFSDIRGFTTLSEQHSPHQVMTWLNDYFTVMTDEVQRHHGVVNKFLGDGLMAVFGVPIPRLQDEEIAQDAQRAVTCALAMGQRLAEINRTGQAQGMPPLQIRIGIFTGPVMVGSLGGKHRLEYGVVGDSVNTAARLESWAKEDQPDHCRVLIAQETLNYLDNQFEVQSWGEAALKGKQHAIAIYRVLGLKKEL
ncbi:MAG TPA: adenylate/guanylate cyclase domain-containing protein [Leptolyngbyaceae cyanobacterium]